MAESDLPLCLSPPHVCRVAMDIQGLSPLKSINLDISFKDLQMFD